MKLSEKILAKKVIEEAEEMDFDKADMVSIWSFISKKISRKPKIDQADMLMSLSKKLMELVQDMPSGNQKLKSILKEFKKEI